MADFKTAAVELIDTAGVAQGVPFYGGNVGVVAQDYLQSIAEGDVPGHSLWSLLAQAPSAPASQITVVPWNAAYVFPAAAQQMRVVSTSAQDGAGGTGIRTLRIFYLKSDYTPATTDVTLNGVTPVDTTPTDLFRINRVVGLTYGTTSAAVGTITLTNLAGAVTYSQISALMTRDRSGVYTVPLGKTVYITTARVGITKSSTTGNAATFTLRTNWDSDLGQLTAGLVFAARAEVNHMDGSFDSGFASPLVVPATTDLKIDVTAAQASSFCTAALRGWIE